MGPMSPRFEIRAAMEIQDLQEKVKVMEEELRRKAAVIETQSFNHKEREAELLNKIECLELANEQLLQGGNDSSMQLQMELTRLQRQNSVLHLRERELQFQINTQEMIKTQMLDKRPAYAEPTNPVKELEAKVVILESKLAEAVEVSNMYKIQLHEAFSRQKSVQSAALSNLGDGEDALKELQKLRKQTKEQEAELLELQDRFFITTVRLAESAAQKEELLSKMKRLQGGR
jgi:chromosome segregation ATPase